MENEQLEQLLLTIEERLVSFERRFSSLIKSLPSDMASKYNLEKDKLRMETGTDYSVSFKIDTDKGVKNTKETIVRAWSEKDARFIHWDKVVYPQLVNMKNNGVIKWFKKL